MRKSLYTRQHKLLIGLLIDARKAAGLTQTDVAKALGRHQSFVAKYENGERRLDVIEFLSIAAALRTDPISLVKRVATGAK